MLRRQAEWQVFAKRICADGGLTIDEDLNCVHLEKSFGGKRVGVVGLNTSWASHANREKGQLWMGLHQVEKAHSMVSECDLRIAVTHHPVSWMNGEEPRLTSRLESDFHVHFHGHEHSAWYMATHGHLRVEAGACYADSPDQCAYSWLQLDLKSQKAEIWVREFTQNAARAWKEAHHPPKTDKDGHADVSIFLQSRTGSAEEPTPATHPLAAKPQNGFLSLSSPGDLADHLQSEFGFVWESEDYKKSPPVQTAVYWPVRLREPTAIHAVQAFAAAGLMRKGAQVLLCIDDLGTPDIPSELLTKALAKYFCKVGGDWGKVEISYFTHLVTAASFSRASKLMRTWLADLNYTLQDVFDISKILNPAKNGVDYTKKPRRLFTPPLVWLCFIQMIQKRRANVTLGGFDERRLWEAWRRVTKGEHPVGHLYIPELKEAGRATHMSDTKLQLSWNGLQDIERALEAAIKDDQPLAEGRLFPWAFRGCLQLPSYLSGRPESVTTDGSVITQIADLDGADIQKLVKPLAQRIEHWMI